MLAKVGGALRAWLRCISNAALKDEGGHANEEVEAGGEVDGSGFAQELHEVLGGGEAGYSRTEGVDGVEEADGLADVAGTADEVLNKQRERAAHEERGDEQQGERDETGDEDGASGGKGCDPMKDRERAGAEDADRDFDCAEGEQQADAGLG